MNRNLIAVVLVLVICLVAFGFYRGRFGLAKSGPATEGNQVDISLTVDQDKVKADAETVKEKTSELVGQAKKGASDLGEQAMNKN